MVATVVKIRPARSFAGQCTGNPRLVPVTEVTPADEAAREDAGWTKPGHSRRATVGKPGAWNVAVPCHFSTTDGEEYAQHLKTVHGARLEPRGTLPGRGFRAPAKTAGEKLALGKPVAITLADGREIAGQVWSEADSTLLGSRRGSAFFAVAGGQCYVFQLDTKAPGAPCSGREISARGNIGDRVTVKLQRGPAADMTLVEETPEPVEPVETPAPVLHAVFTQQRGATTDSGPACINVDKCDSVDKWRDSIEDVPGLVVSCPECLELVDRLTVEPAPVPVEIVEPAPIVAAAIDSGRMVVIPVSTPAPDTVPAPMPSMTRAARKATRREIAARLREQGIRPEGQAWYDACRAAGLPVPELESVTS